MLSSLLEMFYVHNRLSILAWGDKIAVRLRMEEKAEKRKNRKAQKDGDREAKLQSRQTMFNDSTELVQIKRNMVKEGI